ncbi:MAG: cation:proton antiporter [Patescibacteria group bacterium]
MQPLFLDISVIIITAALLGIVAHWLKQPVILAYVAAGFILGPAMVGFLNEAEVIRNLSSLGIAFLLFLVGIELNLKKIRHIGQVSLALGVGQVVFTAALGFLIIRLFGYTVVPSIYIAIALTFSSTIIVIKLLSEQKTLESLYGRITVGMLLVQDLLAIVALILLSSFSSTGSAPNLTQLILVAIKGLSLIVFVFAAQRFILARLFEWLARSRELLLISSLAWCFLVAAAFAAIGFSMEIGAFLAGLALAELPYNLDIASRVRPLRDFFITIFFVVLGAQLVFTSSLNFFWPIIALSLFVLIGNPLIVMVIMALMGYRKRTSFLIGLAVAQISEFSLILMALGNKLGHVTSEQVALVTIIGVITITISSYLITFGDKIYRRLAPYLNWLEGKTNAEAGTELTEPLTNHTILFGYHRLGEKIANTLEALQQPVLIIDFDPTVIKRLISQGKTCLYGDMGDIDVMEKANIADAKMIISTVPDINDNLLLLKDVKKQCPNLTVYVTAETWHDTKSLYEAGADYVIFPHHLSAERFSDMLRGLIMDNNRILVDRGRHLKELELHYANRTRQ